MSTVTLCDCDIRHNLVGTETAFEWMGYMDGILVQVKDMPKRAWHHMRATVGEGELYTANVTHKIAEHLIRSGRSEKVIVMINEAHDIWSVNPSAHKNEITRTIFLKGKLFEATGQIQKASITLRVSCRLGKEITKVDRDVKSLTTEDFGEIVAF